MSRFWKAPVLWPNATVFIVGGGPSLKALDLTPLRGRRTIAINNAFSRTPDPDVIFYADTRWWRWYGEGIAPDYPGRIISACSAGAGFLDGRVCRMGRDYDYLKSDGNPLSEDPTLLSGPDSGYMSINLAYHFGAARIVLLGFDMGFTDGESHWHEDHPVVTPESNYTDLFAPHYPALVRRLVARGVEVLICTPSRLTCVPHASLAAVLALPERQRG